ncbi:MAG: TIGR01777 family oxidoreductase [Deltaproteobacteria bacterium]|nr:TIGR01777 family oxidoreductase [Deltaproteobacteria bacterium]
MPDYARITRVPFPAGEVFDWHLRPGASSRLTPDWLQMRPVDPLCAVESGVAAEFEMRLGPVPLRFRVGCREIDHGRRIVQAGSGPMWSFSHERLFRSVLAEQEPEGEQHAAEAACRLEERIHWQASGVRRLWPERRTVAALSRLLDFRETRLERDLARHASAASSGSMRIAITGASGLVGAALCSFLASGGHRVERLVRRPAASDRGEIFWDPARGEIDAASLEGVDAVVHLAGANIAGRWTREYRRHILESRSVGTGLLAKTLASLSRPPRVLVSSSAIGFYGDTGGRVVDESAAAGEGFLAQVCRAWEAATLPLEDAGVRVVHLRTGIVLTPRGGALARLLPPFRAGLGGPVGSGAQSMSWIAADDAIGAIHHCLTCDTLRGPVNATSPEPVSNAEFGRVLGRVLHRPTRLPLPAALVRMALGEMGEQLLLASQSVAPARLLDSGFRFELPGLEAALRFALGR